MSLAEYALFGYIRKIQIKSPLVSIFSFLLNKIKSIQNNVGGSLSSKRDYNNNNNNNINNGSNRCTAECDHGTPLGPLANLAHLLVEFIKGAYPIFPALVIYYQSHSLPLAVLSFVLTLGLIVYLQLRMINRD